MLRKILTAILLVAGIALQTHANWWVEPSSYSFTDGYFYRCSTVPNGLEISRWTDWLDSTFTYRKVILIDNYYNSNNLINYQISFSTDIKVLIDTGRLDPQGNGIRFTDEDGFTLLNAWVENSVYSSTGTKFWVKVPLIPKNKQKNIYMYYGYVSTYSVILGTAARDGVFDLYEDWESGAIDPAKWFKGTGGDHEFRIANPATIAQDDVYEGSYAVCNSTIVDNEKANLQTALFPLDMPAKVSYYGKAYCQTGTPGVWSDFLTLYPNGIEDATKRLNGLPSPWNYYEAVLPAGMSYVKWEYQKDGGGTNYPDRGWVDKIIIKKYTSIEPVINLVTDEQKKTFYYGTTPSMPAAKYWSNVLDTNGDNSIVVSASWTYASAGANILVQMRTSNTIFLPQDISPLWINVSNPATFPLDPFKGKYIQYFIRFLSDGTTISTLKEIFIQYATPPPRPTEFKAVAMATSTIQWMWKDNASPSNTTETAYRVYSSTRAYPSGTNGYMENDNTTSYGLIAELPPDTTFWYETGIAANTMYSRYVVAANDVGGNASTRFDGQQGPLSKYTKALPPRVNAEIYYDNTDLPESSAQYVKISTGIWSTDKYLIQSTYPAAGLITGNFTSDINSSAGAMEYYRIYWATTNIHNWSGTETIWTPAVTITEDMPLGTLLAKKAETLLPATLNSGCWYMHAASYNGDNEVSTITVLGPFFFNGAPSYITDLAASPSTEREGNVVLTWTAPTVDATFGDFAGNFLIRYKQGIFLVSEADFGTLPGVNVATTTVAGQKQSYSITGLTPGTTYAFAIKSLDNSGNTSEISTNLLVLWKTRTIAAKVAKVVFITSPYTRYVDEWTGLIVIQAQDDNSNPLKLAADVSVLMTCNSGTGLFSQDLVHQLSSLYANILKGDSQSSFYYKDTQSGLPVINAHYTGWSDGSQPQTILPGLPTAFGIYYSGGDGSDGSLVINRGIKYTDIKAIDALGNPSNRYFGGIISSVTPSNQILIPSTHVYITEDGGTKTFQVRNYDWAGAAFLKVQETTDEKYRDIYFINDTIGWAVGDKGTIKKTSNQGTTWVSQLYGTATVNGLYGVYFIDVSTGWAVGYNGLILKTTDSGLNWAKQTSGIADTLFSVYFVNQSTGFVSGAGGRLIKTTDSGATWSNSASGISGSPELRSVVFVSTSNGFTAGFGGVFYKTSDSGSTWASDSGWFGGKDLYRLRFTANTAVGFVVGSSSSIYRTADGGNTWSALPSGTPQALNDVKFRDANTGVAVGASGAIVLTADGGSTWSSAGISIVTAKTLYACDFSNLGFAFGAEGTIIKSANLGLNWTQYIMQGQSQPLYWNGTIVVSAPASFVPPVEIKQNKTNQQMMMFGLRTMYADTSSGNTKPNKIVIKRTGTALSSDISYAKLWRDNPPPAGIFLGQSAFTGDTASISISPKPVIGNTTTWFFITYDVPNIAELLHTAGVQLSENAFTLDLPGNEIMMAKNNLPYDVLPAVIIPSSCTIIMTVNNLASAYGPADVKQGAPDVRIFGLTLKTDRGSSPWRGLTLGRTGQNITDSDILRVNLYRTDITPGNILSSATFTAGNCNLLISTDNAQTLNLAPQQYYITMDISPNSKYSTDIDTASVGLTFNSATNYFLLDTDGANGWGDVGSKIYFSTNVKINVSYNTVSMVKSDIMINDIYQSENKAFLKLFASIDSNNAAWTRLTVFKNGDCSDSDVTSVSLYRDNNGDGIFNIVTDSFVATSAFSGGSADIIFAAPEIIDKILPAYSTYFVTLKVARAGAELKTVGVSIATNTSVGIAPPNKVGGSNFPVDSSTATIRKFPDIVISTLTSIAPPEERVDKTIAVGKITLATRINADDTGGCDAALNGLTISQEGTASTDSVKTIKFYADTDSNGLFSAGTDQLISTSAFDGTRNAVFVFGSKQTVRDIPRTFFIVFELDPLKAVPGKNVGFSTDPGTLFGYDLPDAGKDAKYSPPFFVSSRLTFLDRRTPSVPQITFRLDNPVPATMPDGHERYFTNNPYDVKFDWSADALNGIKEVDYAFAASSTVGASPDVTQWLTSANTSVDFADLNLKHNLVYYLWVKVKSTDGFERSTSKEIKIDLTPPPAPAKPTYSMPATQSGVSAKAQSFWISWLPVTDPESGILAYQIQERSGDSPLWQALGNTTTSQTDYQMTGKQDGRFYYYRVRARNYAGSWSFYSNTSLAAYLSLPAETIDRLANYPNPFDSRYKNTTITYILREDSEVILRFYDLLGSPIRVIHFPKGESPGGAQGTNNITWDGTNGNGEKIAQGMYILAAEVKTVSGSVKKNWKMGVIH